jgi:hypothetical protein
MPVPNVPAVQIVQVVFRKFEETGGPSFSTKVTRPCFSTRRAVPMVPDVPVVPNVLGKIDETGTQEATSHN